MNLQDFLGDTSSGTNFNKDPPKTATPTNSWADSTDDIDPSGECQVELARLAELQGLAS